MAGNEDKIESLLKEGASFPPPEAGREQAYVKSMEEYQALYKRSMEDPEGFWAEQAEQFISWSKPWDKVWDWSYAPDNVYIKWFEGGKAW